MSGKRKLWPILGLGVVLLLLINLAVPAFASENRMGVQVTVGPNEVLPDDLYASGEIITIDGTIKGDLIAFASEIRINGTVEGQVLGGARTIWINGRVGDDVRVAAYQLEITEKGAVNHDVNVAAFGFNALNGSTIGGDVYAGTYQTQLNGTLDGSFHGATNALYINGKIGRDVLVDVAAPDPQFNELGPLMRMSPVPIMGPGLHIGDTGVISGVLKYVSRGEAVIASGAKLSQVIRETPTPSARATRPREPEPERGFGWSVLLWIVAQIRRLITLVIVGLLLIWLLPRLIPEAAHRLRTKPWQSLGWGCVGEIAFFVSLPILFALIIGIGLLLGIITLGGLQTTFIGAGLLLEGLYGVAFTVVTSYFTKIVIGFLVGTLLLEQARSKSVSSPFWALIIGVLLFVIVAAIPILGWLARLAATLFGLGALWLWLRDKWWPPQPVLATVPAGGPAPTGGAAGAFAVPAMPAVWESEKKAAEGSAEQTPIVLPEEEVALGEPLETAPSEIMALSTVEETPAEAIEAAVDMEGAPDWLAPEPSAPPDADGDIEGEAGEAGKAYENAPDWPAAILTTPPDTDAGAADEGIEEAEWAVESTEEPTEGATTPEPFEGTAGVEAEAEKPKKPRRRARAETAKTEEGE